WCSCDLIFSGPLTSHGKYDLKCHKTDPALEAIRTTAGAKKKLLLFKQFPDYYQITSAKHRQFLDECEHSCDVTTDEKRFREADAVIFYSHYKHAKDLAVVPEKRPDQKWGFFAVEPPPLSDNEAFGAEHWKG
ncbi:unnamed protein product, partial [Lymnaea stagnalis]